MKHYTHDFKDEFQIDVFHDQSNSWALVQEKGSCSDKAIATVRVPIYVCTYLWLVWIYRAGLLGHLLSCGTVQVTYPCLRAETRGRRNYCGLPRHWTDSKTGTSCKIQIRPITLAKTLEPRKFTGGSMVVQNKCLENARFQVTTRLCWTTTKIALK